ncbi:MAG: 3-demethoxyubiquinol 3-hydroxylase [Holosporales bacterium]
MIRVNQAGEYGAKRIYKGQLDVIKDPTQRLHISHMANQEEEHLAYFNTLMIEHNVRPTVLHPLWHVGGYLMGAICAKIDPKLAHACTIAVEDVIDEHYQDQLNELEFFPEHKNLQDAISKFKEDEKEHCNTAKKEGGEDHPASMVVNKVVRAITRGAIFLSKKI